MYRKVLKKVEYFIDKRGQRGKLRETFLYQIYKFFKALPMIVDLRVYNLYSRDSFVKKLEKNPISPDIYSHWFNSFNFSSERGWENLYDNYPLPWIYVKATHFIEWHLILNPNSRVLEFGGGTSTFWFSDKVAEIFTIEDNEIWVNQIESLAKKRNINNINIICRTPEARNKIDIESQFQTSVKEYEGYSAENYVNEIDHIDGLFDVIFIDGLCRVSCARKSIKKLKNKGLLVFDDSQRDRYQKFFDEIKNDYKIIRIEGSKAYGQGYGETALIFKK